MGNPPKSKRDYQEIDENLRRVFDEVVNEGVPDRFADLLGKLKRGETPVKSSEGDE
ncbi:hypothetical protein GQ651_02595 [Alphaproteobacteria bacterium GH1-50]|uniref:Anti-sigma factor NepR domain-containing protein n=1 Tax=Kangsaoukella pontilimi TaxID=2691042 RepID=A0A7C9IEL7_9RHOB|nr:NepR family anti-sigma factor [Kangsaoukella pontilimi]MXQ06727.1 hypothetical protein [Kangsaoukella pontilimi]